MTLALVPAFSGGLHYIWGVAFCSASVAGAACGVLYHIPPGLLWAQKCSGLEPSLARGAGEGLHLPRGTQVVLVSALASWLDICRSSSVP